MDNLNKDSFKDMFGYEDISKKRAKYLAKSLKGVIKKLIAKQPCDEVEVRMAVHEGECFMAIQNINKVLDRVRPDIVLYTELSGTSDEANSAAQFSIDATKDITTNYLVEQILETGITKNK